MTKGRDTKPHIGIFGRRNNGKSSLINALTGQDIAIVSDVAGTTTDPVKKSIEIAGIGPVVMIDTAGIDDSGDLGLKRVRKTKEILKIIDLAILIISNNEFEEPEIGLVHDFHANDIPFLIIHNKSDQQEITQELIAMINDNYGVPVISYSTLYPKNTNELINLIRITTPETAFRKQTLVGDLISYGDVVLLITPIDIEAPEGRMILPQVQVIRDVLDHDGIAVVCKEREVDAFLKKMNPRPALVVTDSQVFPKADAAIPKEIPLTSFSIVLARQKGDFVNYMKGTPYLSKLADGDRLLILESCTHHVSCDDIGRMKIPRWLTSFSGKSLEFDVVAGLNTISRPITDYAMVIQCGGCMITRKQIVSRLKPAIDAGIPVTNYGMAIAYVHGIYNRAIAPFTKGLADQEDYL
ncbi:MAG: [FeFe] hydrogenase H-cluster maturation GTPase HydF [Bacteroidales bacterium]|nr:[FeFe] hydrogenase H-cluster maturation GTPase HydF [Bacteroidales bacterium]